MPRALDSQIIPIDEALTQRPAPVHAGVVQRVELPVNIEYGDRATTDFHHYCLPRREIRCVCNLDEVGHYYFLLTPGSALRSIIGSSKRLIILATRQAGFQ